MPSRSITGNRPQMRRCIECRQPGHFTHPKCGKCRMPERIERARNRRRELNGWTKKPITQDMNANTMPTVIPASYPALEQEAYRANDDVDCDMPTLIPPAGEAEELAAESRR